MAYNYLDALKDDIRQYIEDEIPTLEGYDREDLEQDLNDILWDNDSVTGNGSGSYTFSRAEAEENVKGDPNAIDYIREMISEYDEKDVALEKFLSEDWEWFDVSIRCYLLDQAISEILDELYGE